MQTDLRIVSPEIYGPKVGAPAKAADDPSVTGTRGFRRFLN
jgi:hypothetical protein